MAKKRVMLTLDEELLERIEAACKKLGVSKSAYVSTVVAKDMADSKQVIEEFRILLGEMGAMLNDIEAETGEKMPE